MDQVTEKLKNIGNVSILSDKIEGFSDNVEQVKSYSAMLARGTKPSNVSEISKKIVQQLQTSKTNTMKTEETEERNKRTILVRKPADINITNSKHIRSQFNKKHPGMIIQNCRITAGGSFKIELDIEEEAESLRANWSTELFGGNEGKVSQETLHTSGIIKHVYEEVEESELVDNIQWSRYNVSNVELFKRDNKFTGTLKVTFKERKDLVDAINDRISILQERYIIEEFKPSPRVIKCNRCQGFCHIARRCRSKKPKCGKHGQEDHETKECDSDTPKCAHSKENHLTGDKSCKVMKQKLEGIKQRYQYDY